MLNTATNVEKATTGLKVLARLVMKATVLIIQTIFLIARKKHPGLIQETAIVMRMKIMTALCANSATSTAHNVLMEFVPSALQITTSWVTLTYAQMIDTLVLLLALVQIVIDS